MSRPPVVGAWRHGVVARLASATPGLVVVGLVVEDSLAPLGLPSTTTRLALVAAVVAALAVPVVRGAVHGFLVAALAAVTAATVGGAADVLRFGLLGTGLLVVAGVVSTVEGAAPWRQAVARAAVGAVTTGLLMAVVPAGPQVPPLAATVVGLVLAATAFGVVERLRAVAAPDPGPSSVDR